MRYSRKSSQSATIPISVVCGGKPASVSTFVFFPLIVLTLTVYRCFAHIINLAVVAFMNRITKIAAVDNANMIWDYDPALPDNCIEGGLDMIAALRTVITKVRVES